MDPPLPPLPNINDDTVGSVNVAAASSDLVSSPSANALSVVDDFFGSAFSDNGELDDGFLGEGSVGDDGNRTVNSGRNIFELDQEGVFPDDGAEENDVSAFGVPFPAEQPFFENRYHNQKENHEDEGYDSEGNLPHFADVDGDDIDAYDETPIDRSDAPSSVLVGPLTLEAVGGLGVKELKDELRKRGRSITGKKIELVARLKDAIASNVPVSSGDGAARPDSMTGLDMGAKWVLLTRHDVPVPEPINEDLSLRPPTERDGGQVTPKFGFVETFDRMPFTGTTELMRYARPRGASSSNRQKGDKGKKRRLSPVRQGHPSVGIKPRVLGGPNNEFIKRYGLDEVSHPMDWFTAFMPLTPDMNRENPAKANVKGDGVSIFAVSNWTQYSNLKAHMVGAGKKGHIFAGKYKPFNDTEILQMLGIYIIDGLAPSHQLVQKMQSQSKQPMHGNDKIAARSGRDISNSIVRFATSLGSKIL